MSKIYSSKEAARETFQKLTDLLSGTKKGNFSMCKHKVLLVAICTVLAGHGFAAEKKETAKTAAAVQTPRTQTVQPLPAYSVVEVQETGGETFFRATGRVINGIFKAAALPLNLLGMGLDYCTPNPATHRVIVPNVQPAAVTQPVIQQPIVQPAVVPTPVSVAPAPVVVAPAPVVVAPVPVYYRRCCYPRHHRYWHHRYYY